SPSTKTSTPRASLARSTICSRAATGEPLSDFAKSFGAPAGDPFGHEVEGAVVHRDLLAGLDVAVGIDVELVLYPCRRPTTVVEEVDACRFPHRQEAEEFRAFAF